MEIAIGSQQDQRFVRNYLRHVRSLPAHTYVTDRAITSLDQVRDGAWRCDWPLFEQLVDDATNWIENELEATFDLIPFSSWFLIDGTGPIGGFYSKDSYGYCDIPGLAFMAKPVGDRFNESADRSLELARGYLHDCFHASTFRSYGVKRGKSLSSPKSPPTIYRFQHGFNFRRADGTSYSPPQRAITNGGINLGVMMDGVGSILAGRAIGASLPKARIGDFGDLLLADVLCETPISNGTKFFSDVIETTHEFLERYDRIPITHYAKIMFSGDVGSLAALFSARYGSSWRDTFCQAQFMELLDPDLHAYVDDQAVLTMTACQPRS